MSWTVHSNDLQESKYDCGIFGISASLGPSPAPPDRSPSSFLLSAKQTNFSSVNRHTVSHQQRLHRSTNQHPAASLIGSCQSDIRFKACRATNHVEVSVRAPPAGLQVCDSRAFSSAGGVRLHSDGETLHTSEEHYTKAGLFIVPINSDGFSRSFIFPHLEIETQTSEKSVVNEAGGW